MARSLKHMTILFSIAAAVACASLAAESRSEEPQALVRVSILRGGRPVASGSGAFIDDEGAFVTSFELLRTIFENSFSTVEFKSQKGNTLSSFDVIDCAHPTLPCLLKLPVKPSSFLRLGAENVGGHVLGYQGGFKSVDTPVSKKSLDSRDWLKFEDGALLLNSTGKWIRVLSRVPGPEGPVSPIWVGYDEATLKRKLALPTENLPLARKAYGEARAAAVALMKEKYVKVAYSHHSDRLPWPVELFRSVNFGSDPIYSGLIPRWFTRCASKPPYSLECSDAVGSATLRVSVRDVKPRYLAGLAGKPMPGSGSAEPVTCKDSSGIDRNAPLVVGYECQYPVPNDRYPNAFSLHQLLQKGEKLYDFWLWFRDPFMLEFFVHIPGLLKLSSVPAGK